MSLSPKTKPLFQSWFFGFGFTSRVLDLSESSDRSWVSGTSWFLFLDFLCSLFFGGFWLFSSFSRFGKNFKCCVSSFGSFAWRFPELFSGGLGFFWWPSDKSMGNMCWESSKLFSRRPLFLVRLKMIMRNHTVRCRPGRVRFRRVWLRVVPWIVVRSYSVINYKNEWNSKK